MMLLACQIWIWKDTSKRSWHLGPGFGCYHQMRTWVPHLPSVGLWKQGGAIVDQKPSTSLWKGKWIPFGAKIFFSQWNIFISNANIDANNSPFCEEQCAYSTSNAWQNDCENIPEDNIRSVIHSKMNARVLLVFPEPTDSQENVDSCKFRAYEHIEPESVLLYSKSSAAYVAMLTWDFASCRAVTRLLSSLTFTIGKSVPDQFVSF